MSYVRQMDIFNPAEYNHGINIIGVGGSGSAIALCLAKLGMAKFSLWDPDVIEQHNLPNQMYPRSTIGSNKAECCRDNIIYPNDFEKKTMVSVFIKELTKKDNLPYPITIVCTDTMKSRKIALDVALKSKNRLLIDTRMAGTFFQVFTVNLTDKKEVKKYKQTFHEEVQEACTNRSVIFNLFGLASFVANQLIKVFKGKKYLSRIDFGYNDYMIFKTE